VSTKPFDATLKDIAEVDVDSWPSLAGSWPIRRVTLIDAEVSTVTAASDKVFRIEGDGDDWLLHFEWESSHAGDAAEQAHLYSCLLRHRHGLLVRSVVVLLRPEANATNLTGRLEVRFPDEVEPYDVFRYRVIKVWELPLDRLLTGGLGTLALAPLTDEAANQLPAVLRRMEERLQREAAPPIAAKLRAATFVLLGLRYSGEMIDQLFQGVMAMEESSTYQLLLTKGELRHARRQLLTLGCIRFGPPDDATTAAVDSINELHRLDQLLERLLAVSSWQELLTTPLP